MQLSDLRKRLRLTERAAAFRGDEGLIPDVRGGLRPADCIERKLGTLLTEETLIAPGGSPRGTASSKENRGGRRIFK